MGLTFRLGQVPLAIFTDSSNNVGIGAAASGSFKFQVTGTTNLTGALSGTSAVFSSSVQSDFLVVGTTAATSGGLRLGTQVAIRARNVANTANIPLIESTASDGVSVSNGALILASTGAATFSSSVAIGTTLSAWDTGTFPDILQVGNASLVTLGTAYSQLGNNSYYDGTNYRYISNGGAQRMVYDAGGDILWATAASGTAGNTFTFSERMRITSGGNVGIGNSNPLAKLSVVAPVCIVDIESSTSTAYNGLELKNGSGSFYVGQDNSSGNFYGGGAYSGNLYLSGAYPMVFWTGGSERMRITSGGDVLLGATSVPSGAVSMGTGSMFINNNLYIGNTAGTGGYAVRFDGYANALYAIWQNASGTDQGGVYLSYAATSWTANSDERLKNINSNIENAVDKLNTLRAVNYSWKTDETKKENLGLIAQDVEKVFPQVIDENKDGYLGVRYADLIPVLIAAIQEQNEIITKQGQAIEELKALIAAK